MQSKGVRYVAFFVASPALLIIAGLLLAARPASSQSGSTSHTMPFTVHRIAETGIGPARIDLMPASPTATPIPPPATAAPASYPLPTPVPPTATFTPGPYPPVTPETPIPTSSPATSPCPGCQVMGTTWEDANGNDSHDEADPLLSGVTITLRDYATGQIICTEITGADGHYDCDDLSAGIYLLKASGPPDYQAITPQEWGIDVFCSTIKVDFGYWRGE